MSQAGLASVSQEGVRIVLTKAQFDPTTGVRGVDRIQKFLPAQVDDIIAELQVQLDDIQKLKDDIDAL